MFFSAEDDEQDFMAPGSSSRLANLFGIDKASSQGGNESLTYTAPKQPKPKEPATQSEGAPSVLFATAVNAYKYVDGKYASQGKLGAAILAKHGSMDYRVLLYVSKQQQVTNAKITPAFTFTIQPNNYAVMYDDSRQTWSLNFDSEQNVQQFAKNIGLARALSGGSSLDNVISQDMSVGEGAAVETGSSVEVKYTGWLLTNNTIGQEFDSNEKSEKMFRFQIGKGKVIKGWDTGVVGMKKSMKRQLIVPPSHGYGSKGAGSKIPPNSTLIFEITIMRIKGAKGASPSPSPAPESVPDSTPSPVPDHDEHTVKERSKSISEQMSTGTQPGKSGKARLISKMAKMGQPILPMMGGATPAEPEEGEESEGEEGSIEPESPQPMAASPPQHQATKPKLTKPKPVHAHPAQPMGQPMTQQYIPQQQPVMSAPQPAFIQNLPQAQQLAVYQPPQPAFGQPQPQATIGQFQPGQPMYNQQYQTPASDTQILPVLTENRQQTTELRISMGKVADKVDRILEKVDVLQNQQNGQLTLQSTQPNMEASVLMHNVQRIVQENDRLRKEGYEKSSKIESLNNKISELLQSNQQYVEKSQTLLEQRNEGFISSASQSQAKVLALEQEKVQLTTELSNATALYSTLQLEVTNLRKKEIEYQQKIGTSSTDSVRLQEELEALKTQKIDDSQKITELSTNYKEEKGRRKHLETQMSQIQEEFNDIKSSKETLEKNLSDRKKKAAAEKRSMEEEFEENKEQLEREIQILKDKLRKAKTSTDTATAEQVSQVEEELNKDWKEKCDKLLATQQEKHKRAIQEVEQENEELQSTIQQLEQKIQNMKSSSGTTESQVSELQEQIEEMSVWKDKYENLRNQATNMKEKYEERIEELESERDRLEEEKDQAVERVQKTAVTPAGGNQSVVGEVKKIMNSVYQELKSKFDDEGSYSGSAVLGHILNSIKSTTLKLVQSASQVKEEDNEDDEESEEEEEEDSDESDEEEKDDPVKDEDKNEVDDKQDNTENLKAENLPSDLPEVLSDGGQQFSQSQDSIGTENTQETPQSSESFVNVEKEANDGSHESENKLDESDSLAEDTENESKAEDTENGSKEEITEKESCTNQTENKSSSSETESESKQAESVNNTDDSAIQNGSNTNEADDSKTIENGESKPKIDLSDFDIPKVEKNNKSKTVPPLAATTQPPPLFDEVDEEETTQRLHSDSLFGDDDHVEDTLGISFKKEENKGQETKKKPSKVDLLEDDDSRPQPPPPLFGDDDDDDDDLDWLS